MNQRMWKRQILFKYALFQLPEVILPLLVLVLIKQWIYIPMWAVWIITLILLVINAILYPFVWRAYDKSNSKTLIGSQGIAVDRLSPSGHVRINSELWQARVMEGHEPIDKGECVMAKDVHGLTLIVHSDTRI